ncbi:MAG TPA: endo-1,4-beta-xylanase [Stellaceae bacterium]|nr:endo-1,4-beta-xylanase [Stellaceae bacterium]
MRRPLSPIRLSRRNLLRAAALGALAGRGRAWAAGEPTPLHQLAAERGIAYGTYIYDEMLKREDEYTHLAEREAAFVTSSSFHWFKVEPNQGSTDFAGPDAVEAWARAHELGLRGHALVWGEAAPRWFGDIADRAAAARALERHVAAMCRHFAGRLQSWDVVNEALKVNEGHADGLRRTVFYEKIGPAYLDIAFRAAREADRKTRLVYNEFDLELDLPEHRDKRRFLLAMIDGFRQRGTPIDAVGLQSHLSTDGMAHFDEKIFAGFLKDLADRGLEIMLTELDVIDRLAPADITRRDEAVAETYRRYLDVALANRAVKTVVSWGLTDRNSWIDWDNPRTKRADGLHPRPLPFDEAFRPKPAYFAIADAFRRAPPR